MEQIEVALLNSPKGFQPICLTLQTMNSKFSRNLFLALGALIFSMFSTTKACAWSEDWEGAFYRFFEPDYKGLQEYKPFHFTFDRLYDYELLSDSTSQSANLAAWTKYLGPSVPVNDIRQVVYGMKLDALNQVKADLDKGRALPPDLANNAIAKDWKANRRRDLLDYLLLAHAAEPFCDYVYDEWSEEPRQNEGIESVIQRAKDESQKATDPFLKLRYGYQALRLQQYSEGPAEAAIETYQKLVLPHASADKLIASWSQCHFAGCLRNMELEAEAAYQFSRVFDECPSRRIQAWYGWRINSDEIWEAVQAKCKNNHEMAVVYFLRAFSPNAISMEDMQHIHELDPGTKLLDVLLLREVNKLENSLLGYPFSGEMPMYKRLAKGEARELHGFVQRTLQSGKMYDRNIWELANVYLQFLDGDFAGASAGLAAKQASFTGEGVLKGKLMDLVFRIASAKTVDHNLENAIYKDFTNLAPKLSQTESENLARFRDDALGWLYDAQGEKAKALLARDRGYAIANFPIDIALVDEMIAFQMRGDKTLYEKDLLKRLNPEGNVHDFLLELKGTGLLGRNQMAEAITVFSQISSDYRESAESFKLEADPFRNVVIDVVNCENCDGGKYNKLSFAEAVVALQKKAAADPANAVDYNLQLGNAYYATSYFGAAWRVKDYYRSGGSWYSLGENDEYFQFDKNTFEENVDMSLAKEYYAKALNNAKDKEKAALLAFMVAKCELNEYYMAGAEADFNNYRKGFARLKNDYRKTAMYKDLIKECKDLRAYTGN
jgi:hypothetical protein